MRYLIIRRAFIDSAVRSSDRRLGQETPLMRTPLIGLGAAALATVTVVSGVGFGPAATAAPRPSAATPAAAPARVVGPLVTESSDIYGEAFSAPTSAGRGEPIPNNRTSTLAEALAKAVSWTIPGEGSTGPISPVSDPMLCVTAGILNANAVLDTCVPGAANQQFTRAANTGSNNPIGVGLKSTSMNGFLGMHNVSPEMKLQQQAIADRVVTFDRMVAAFSANVDSVDVPTRSATISGTAAPDASVIVRVGDYESSATADDTGAWSFAFPHGTLRLGANTASLEQWEGGAKTDSTELAIPLEVAAVTASAAFDGDPDAPVHLSGTAEPGATVEIRDATTDAVLGTTTASDAGTWATTLDAPNRGGDRGLIVDQRIDGERNGDVALTVHYGAAVVVQRPADGTEHSGGTVAMSGTGEPNARVEVHADGTDTPIATGTVRANGNWSFDTTALDNRRHVLVVTQHGKGGNTTEQTVTLNPDAEDVELTAEGRFDDDVTKPATISGVATDGATVTLFGPSGQSIDTVIAADGTYSFDITPIDAGEQRYRVTQTPAGGRESAPKDVVLDYGAAVGITSPGAGRVVPGDVEVRGTGSPGAIVTITAGSRSTTTTVDPDGTYTGTVEVPPSGQLVGIDVAQASKGALRTTAHVEVTPDATQQLHDIVFTEPADHTYVPAADTVVRGTATPYAKLVVKNQWGTSVGSVTADGDGDWAFSRKYGPSALYTLTATQTLFDGRTQTTGGFDLAPVGAFRDLVITSPSSPATYSPDQNLTFTGTATPGAAIVATNQSGDEMFRTRADQTDGSWRATRKWGPSAEYVLTITQTALDGTTDRITDFRLSPDVPWTPMTVTSDADGDAYRPGTHEFSGAGTPGATIVATDTASGRIGSATVAKDGSWSFDAELGPDVDYEITFEQTRGSESNVVELGLVAPRFRPFVLTSPQEGEQYLPGVQSTFTGTASPFATITVHTQRGTHVFTTEADKDGKWEYTRAYGPSNTYVLDFVQTPLLGDPDGLEGFVWAPIDTK
jgi:hypothetical protein